MSARLAEKKIRCEDCRAKHAHCPHGFTQVPGYPAYQVPATPSHDADADKAATIRRLTRELDKAKCSKAELVGAVYQAAKDAIGGLEIKPVPVPTTKTTNGGPEIAVAVLSDLQLAKVTPTYSSAICEERVEHYARTVVKLAGIQRADHPVKELRVWLLGDVVEGEMIFPGQAHLIDASLYRQMTVDGPRIVGNFLRTMLANFERVKVTAVIGNHGALGGRARREYNPESNADRMLYRIVEQILCDEKRLSWNIPDGANERNWYALDSIGKMTWLLCHGDQFRWGIKTPSTEQKILAWNAGGIGDRFDEVVCGHWHTMNWMTLKGGDISLRVNGSTESFNTYAQEFMGSMSRPAQWLFFAHPDRGVTAEFKVWLDQESRSLDQYNEAHADPRRVRARAPKAPRRNDREAT